jgi:hypothetical protein|tara:strand:- start:7 stop:510 length:504 start_codon:yes stop_codon:yes gene_type:complete
MNRYRLNYKNFSKFKRGFRLGEKYIEQPCLNCQTDANAILLMKKETYYRVPLELQKKYKKYLPKLAEWETESTEENRLSIEILFWECANCGTKAPINYINWNKKGKITGNHLKLFELIEDLDDVGYNSGLKEKWHLDAFEKGNFINISNQVGSAVVKFGKNKYGENQ